MPSEAELAVFCTIGSVPAVERSREHDGVGTIRFRRMFDASAFSSPIDFVDVTVVPPGSTIGKHTHVGTEEIYIVLAGAPLVEVDGDARRLLPGDVSVVRSGGSHALVNDSGSDVQIAVVQVRI